MQKKRDAHASLEVLPRNRLVVMDLFAGVGGFSLGFLEASLTSGVEFDVRLLVDTDEEGKETFTRNYPKIPYLVADIGQCSGALLRNRAGLGSHDELHVLVGGPPCQAFSRVGKRVLTDPRNGLVLEFLRLVRELRPLAVLMENVPLIMTAFDGVVSEEINEAFREVGYQTIAAVVAASDYGVPQYRKRAIIIAYRDDLGVTPALPAPTHEKIAYAVRLPKKRKAEPADGLLPFVSVEDAIGDLAALKAGEGEESSFYSLPATSAFQRWARAGSIGVFNHRARGHTDQYLKKIKVIKEGERNATLSDEERFSDTYFSQAYARLHRKGIAHTITANFGNPGSGRFLHYRDLRSITVREAARFQSFRDRFIFHGFHLTQMRHVGNAVPVLLARALAVKVSADLIRDKVDRASRNGKQAGGWHETPELRSRIMRAVPGKNTGAELKLRQALASLGIRGYRLHPARIPGCPDIYFPTQRFAVFVDGCFWHGCPKCYRAPKTRKEYWALKVKRNQERDKRNVALCADLGIRVMRVWEHEIARRCEAVARKILKRVSNQRRCR
jgi:DNA (cytosine-5)-methyltransferase 1